MAAKWRRRDARERILERGGGNDPPPPPPRAKSIACIREIRGGEEEEGKEREGRFVVCRRRCAILADHGGRIAMVALRSRVA